MAIGLFIFLGLLLVFLGPLYQRLLSGGDLISSRGVNIENESGNIKSGNLNWCAGRFSFATPSFLLEEQRASLIYRVVLSTVAGDPEEFIKSRVGEKQVVREFENGSRRYKWLSSKNASDTSWPLIASMKTNGHSLILESTYQLGREAIAEQLFTNIFDAYKADSVQDFCTGLGSVTSEPSRNERTSLRLISDKETSMFLLFETETISEPRDDPNSNLPRLSSSERQIVTLSSKKRALDGFVGTEHRFKVQDSKDGDYLQYSWFHAGSPAQGLDPEIQFSAHAPLSQRDRLDQAWEAALSSFRMIKQYHK